jgi:hypothetical protein
MKCHMEFHLEDCMVCHMFKWMKCHIEDRMRYAYTVNYHDCMQKWLFELIHLFHW